MPNIKSFKTKEEYLEWYRNYRKKNIEKIRKYKKKYNKIYRKENGYKNEYRSKIKYPEKYHANQLLNYAIKKRRIKRGNCEVCNKKQAQGHHDDYTKPLDVRWLCHLHHAEYHKNNRDLIKE